MDLTKYNLRCNRSISEKMMKEDFIYDIKPTQFSMYKLTENKSSSAPTFLRLVKPNIIYQAPAPARTTASVNNELRNSDVGVSLPTQRRLNFQCNFCYESLPTLFSLSTHVKFHLKDFCKKCYWVLENNESMEQHVQRVHSVN